ncbi:MAG: cell surface protein SprA [Bacteroidota bacterium]|nr:cell surface protein SprA [Bacteroidota bacterium]
MEDKILKALIKYTLVGSLSLSMLAVITKSHADSNTPLPKYRVKGFNGNNIALTDTPETDTPITNADLHYPIHQTGYDEYIYQNQHPLELNSPGNIKNTTTYEIKNRGANDTVKNQFLFEQKMGNTNYRPPIYMSEEEYQDYLFRKQVKTYFKSRIKADDATNQTNPNKLIPTLNVGGELFDRIFGGNTVDIRPNGSAELSFGLVTNKNGNPAIPVKQRKITNFDFNMKVQLNLVGKIGEKLKLTTNYNTEASFDFENQMKIEYNGLEDEILKTIEAGNVTLPLTTSLIPGSQSLFGVKTKMQFGRLTATTVLSQERGKKTEVTLQGGSQSTNYVVTADNYEANRHYFLGQYFRDNYNASMKTIPLVSSNVVITKIEVWVTNRSNQQDEVRNIAGFADLGEDQSKIIGNLTNSGCVPAPYTIIDSSGALPRNGSNSLYNILTNEVNGIIKDRDFSSIANKMKESTLFQNTCNFDNQFMEQGRDFDVVNRARKLKPTEYIFNKRLGFISLNQALNYDEVLCVAYQYTSGGQTYQVGEFSDQFPTGDQPLYLKLLKSTVLNTKVAMWDLMMKNVYSIGGYQINPQDFKFEVFRMTKGVDLPYINVSPVASTPLLQVFGLDQINVNGDKSPDGYFDFVEGTTIIASNGRVYMPLVEPFGNDLKSLIGSSNETNDYIFQELYDSTKVIAQQQTKKNVYKIKGQYKSSSSSEISLNAMNVPQGSVKVTAGGVPLTENVDYTVDYTLGRVKIINESIMNSGQPIKVSSESNSMFNIQQKSLIGTRLDYKVNKDFSFGGTFLRLTERPLTQKVNFGDEPVSNIMWGADFSHRADAPWLTRLVDKIPLINTKEKSSIQTSGEFAQLIAGHSKAINTTGDKGGNSYLDDFEGSVSLIDLRSAGAWSLASIPQGNTDDFPEANLDSSFSGYNRAKFAWYTVDQSVFYLDGNIKPGNITKAIQSNNFMRSVVETELFPNKQPPNGQPVLLPVLDLAFYPNERGPYNFDVNPTSFSSGIDFANSNTSNGIRLNNPESRWGGIMRRMENPDFQTANIEFIQFWMMDPFNTDYSGAFPGYTPPANGEMIINIGNVSEDILKDGRMAFENGIPKSGSYADPEKVVGTPWGFMPSLPIITPAFDIDESIRENQDVGYDGVKNSDERTYFTAYLSSLSGSTFDAANADPSGDNYHFYRGDDFDNNAEANTLYRYKWFNNMEGNSPTVAQYEALNNDKYPTTATTIPNTEDVNKDNTLSETEAYYQYRIKITPQDITPANVGNNYITNVYTSNFTDASGNAKSVNWYLFKVPVANYEQKVGSIEGFNSIRFMRTILQGFSAPVVCRMARMELVRSDWRRYDGVGAQPGDYIGGPEDGATFDISAVNVQENGTKTPVNYVIPPGINQQQNVQTTNLVLLNEQALVLRTCGLADGYAKAAYKNVSNDVRSYKKMQMFVHAEKLGENPLQDGEMQMFVRFGTDFVGNYYEYIVPLKLTAAGNYDGNSDGDREAVWPTANKVEIDFEQMINLKFKREAGSIETVTEGIDGGKTIKLVGNPTISDLRTIMVGIRNPKDIGNEAKCVEVWINELRLTDFIQKGGWAANARVTAKLADFGQLALSGSYMTPFFGSIEKKVSERSRETNIQYDASTTLQLGKFFPADWKINLPVYLNRGEVIATPQFDPSNPDVLMTDIRNYKDVTDDQLTVIRNRAQDYTRRRGFNFTNISKQKSATKTKSHFWDIENFSVTYAFSEQFKRNITQELNLTKNYRAALTYGFTANPKNIKPFAKSKAKWINNKWFALIKDFNFTPMPSRLGFNTDITRNYNEYKSRNISSDAFSLPSRYNKTFIMNRTYDFKWDFTKALKFDFTAGNDARVLEPESQIIGEVDTQDEKDVIKKNILAGGINIGYRHSANLTYAVPINKIPIFDWVTANASYKTNYQFTRRPFAADSMGNTIMNGNTKSLNTQFNMVTLYNKIPYFKKVNTGASKKNKDKSKSSSGANDTTKKQKDIKLFEHIARLIMTLKQAQFTYTENNGTTLPGYTDSTRILGMNPNGNFHPGIRFVSGGQQNVMANAMKDSLFIRRDNLNSPFAQTKSKQINFTAKLEPFKDFRIDLTGTKSEGYNSSQYVGWNSTEGRYTTNTFTQTGNFSISTITIKSAFAKDDKVTYSNSVFDNFLSYRETYAKRLSDENPFSSKAQTTEGYDGYSRNQQDVILNSFVAAYTGKGSGANQSAFPKMPLPNWTLTYDGLSKFKFMKRHFKTITLRHSYKSTYNVGSFSNNILFTVPTGQDFEKTQYSPGRVDPSNPNSNLVSKYLINTVTIQESFSPLVKIDIVFAEKKGKKTDKKDAKSKGSLTANFEMRKDRTVSLNANIPQITETRGQEYIIGAGYRYPKLKLNKIKIKGKPLESDLNCKVDLSLRNNVTTQRRVIDGLSVPSQGQNIITLKTSVDYALSQNINLRLYFDKIINKPVVSTSFPTANTNAGFSLRFSLAQ